MISFKQPILNLHLHFRYNWDKKLRLYDVFVPLYKGKKIKEDEIIKDFGKGDCMQIFAQFEAFV